MEALSCSSSALVDFPIPPSILPPVFVPEEDRSRVLQLLKMPTTTAKRLSGIKGLSLTMSMSAADEINKQQQQHKARKKPHLPRGSVIETRQETEKGESRDLGSSSKKSGYCKCTKSRPKSVSPPRRRAISYDWDEFSRIDEVEEEVDGIGSSRKRSSKKWSLKEFLYRSSSEGRDQRKERERLLLAADSPLPAVPSEKKTKASKALQPEAQVARKANGVAKKKISGGSIVARPANNSNNETIIKSNANNNGSVKSDTNKDGRVRSKVRMSRHELYYQKNKAQAEELKRKSFLPYRQGLLGCLGPFPNYTPNNQKVLQTRIVGVLGTL